MSAKGQLFAPLAADRNISSSPMTSAAPPDTYSTMFLEKAKPASGGFLLRLISSIWDGLVAIFDEAAKRFIPKSCAENPETARRARLICRFGHLGVIFGAVYASFYLCIGHTWGALVVVLCSTGFGLAPWLMKRTESLDVAGNILSLILVLGFSTLCCVEGGMHGHAIAWLASVPLCSMLLLGRTGAGRWMIASFAACAIIVLLGLSHDTPIPPVNERTADSGWIYAFLAEAR